MAKPIELNDIKNHIKKINSPGGIFELFKLLNYPKEVLFDTSAKRKKEAFDFKKDDSERIKEVYSILSFDEELPVFMFESTTLAPSFIRSVTNTFDRQYLRFLLIFVSDFSELVFVFPKKEKVETGKSPKLKLTKLIINREEIHYTDVETLSNIYFEEGKNWRDVWRKWDKAFSVERVTEAFFEDYKRVFFNLRKELVNQKIRSKESHGFTLQFLNRVMFIYFISKKRWLEYPRFINWLWDSYKKLNKYGSDEFNEKWLKQVFFKAFNNRSNEITDLPEDVCKVISNSPYLNGGLFRENELDNLEVKITDEMFKEIFDFFEKYNFTIKEDMPLDQEVAVDPQMIGYVYESLANVAGEIYDRNDMGIFYTPRVEVEFMCRRSLVEYLSKQMPIIPKHNFYHLVFGLPEDREQVEKWFDSKKLWNKLEDFLDNLSVIDPACGSGAFLVGMLNTLAELYKIIYRKLNRFGVTDFDLKFGILQRSLYGVDVMPWAVHAAELRLWLQLIVETEFKKEQLRRYPLLPNLKLKLKIGDSLVQEIGGISFNLRTDELISDLKKKLEGLKQEKRSYFGNYPAPKFNTPEEIKAEEIRLFDEIIEYQIDNRKSKIDFLRNSFEKRTKQTGLFGTAKTQTQLEIKLDKEKKEIDNEIKNKEEEIKNLNEIKELLKNPEKKPFVWDIDFAEIFGDKNGFDIVIGNPPYVRQELISPPNKTKAEVTLEDRREYKDKLIKSVRTQFHFVEKLDKKSDYYIYFYFHGLSLLNEKGTFCFITSNSWLDVGYGKNLQEFLCKYVPITAVYDNPKRSFEHADVNTIIALFGSPRVNAEKNDDLRISGSSRWFATDHTAKFVMFRKSFEEVLSSKNLIEIDNIKVNAKGETITDFVKNVVKTNDYRIFPVLQEDLLEDGWEYPENYDKTKGKFKAGSYEGNKWGGKYLRAPDIFYTILEKGKGKLVELGKIAKVRRGFTTGVNEFFYLDKEAQEKWNIEEEFLKPVIKSPKECETIIVDPKKLKFKVFMCNKPKSELKGTNALKYIEWGEKQKTENGILWCKVPTISGRKKWYELPELPNADVLFNQFFNERFLFPWNKNHILVDHAYYYILYPQNTGKLVLVLNSVINFFMVEIYGRTGLGEGALQTYAPEIKPLITVNPEKLTLSENKIVSLLDKYKNYKPTSLFSEVGFDISKPIREQEPNPLPDRAELDNMIFDELGLSEDERKEVYWSVCELVKQRLDKAGSLKKK